MNTESRRSDARRLRARRGFFGTLAAVIGVLAVLGGAGSVVSLVQGPRLSQVQSDPAGAIEASGSRVLLTANQALAPIDPTQVSVSPQTPFTVDAAGRSVGVRFTVPLDDATEYTVTVAGVTSVGGGPRADLVATVRTPVSSIYTLQRSVDGDDTIVQSDLSGEHGRVVYTAPMIDDFRVTSTALVVSEQVDTHSVLAVTDRDGEGRRELRLPGEGTVTGLQVSDRGELAGYVYTDADPGAPGARASVLVTASLRDAAADPSILSVADAAPSILTWRFVPDSSALLYIDFDGALTLFDPAVDDPQPVPMGNAATIDSITRGTYTAIVERLDAGVVQLDLTTGEEVALALPENTANRRSSGILPVPTGGFVRQFADFDATGLPTTQGVAFDAPDGTTREVYQVAPGGSLMQVCVSPSGRYVAVLEAPNLVSNPVDYGALQPVPTTLRTHILALATGEEVSTLTGFDLDWCAVGPWTGS